MPRPTIAQISEQARAYLARNVVGGSLHIVLDDGNVEDDHVAWCEGYASGKEDEEGRRLAGALRLLSVVERRALYLADWHVPTKDFLDTAARDAGEEDLSVDGEALQAEIDRRGRLVEEQERELDRLRARVAELENHRRGEAR